MGAFEILIQRAGDLLAPHGQQLRPVHDALGFVETLTDEESDWLVGLIAKVTGQPADVVITTIKPLLERGQDLTDGVPDSAAAPVDPAAAPVDPLADEAIKPS